MLSAADPGHGRHRDLLSSQPAFALNEGSRTVDPGKNKENRLARLGRTAGQAESTRSMRRSNFGVRGCGLRPRRQRAVPAVMPDFPICLQRKARRDLVYPDFRRVSFSIPFVIFWTISKLIMF
jgi:hypothetical protein